MKKTLLLALLSASSLALASGKVELTHTLGSDKVHYSESDIDLKNNLESTHKLAFVVSEDKFSISGELKSKGNHTTEELKDVFSFDGGNVKLAYKHNDIDASFKLEFPSKNYEIYGAYTHKKGDMLSAKPSLLFRNEALAKSGKLATELLYKYNDKFSLENIVALSGGYSQSGEFVFPQFLKDNKVKDGHTTFVVSDDLKVVYKPTEEIKLTASGSFKYNSETLIKKTKHEVTVGKNKTEFNGVFASKTPIDIMGTVKAEYTSKSIAGLKADASVSYGKTFETLDASTLNAKYTDDTGKQNKLHKLRVVTTATPINLELNTSYKYELGNGFSITPALSGKYDSKKSEYKVMLDEFKAENTDEGSIKTQKIVVTPKLSAGYKMDKFDASLGLEVPVTFESLETKYPKVDEIKSKLVLSHLIEKDNFKDKKGDISYDKTGYKLLLNLKYSW